MAYKVKLTAPAEADAYAAFERIREVAPCSADKWLRGLFAALRTLDEMPARYSLIPEADELGHPARQLLYGTRTVFTAMMQIESVRLDILFWFKLYVIIQFLTYKPPCLCQPPTRL